MSQGDIGAAGPAPAGRRAPRTWPWTLLASLPGALWGWRSGLETPISFAGDISRGVARAMGYAAPLTLLVIAIAGIAVHYTVMRKRGGLRPAVLPVMLTAAFGGCLAGAFFAGAPMGAASLAAMREPDEVATALQSYNLIVRQDSEDYIRDLREAGVEKILEVSTIARDPSLKTSKAMLARVRALATEYRETAAARDDDMRDAIRARMRTRGKGEADQAKAVAEFDARTAGYQATLEEGWDIEAEILTEVENALGRLSKSRGSWLVREGKILFRRQSDLNYMSARMDRIRELSLRQKQLERRLLTPAGSEPS